MLSLHQPPPAWGLPNMSPFCVKLETYLKMAQIPYEKKPGSPMNAPQGKIPFIKDDGVKMGDSGFIIDYLVKKHGDKLDSHLTPEQKARALSLRRQIEEHTYFATAWLRWHDADSWKYVEEFFLGLMPPVLGRFILKGLRKKFLRQIAGQGIGRHSRSEIIELAKTDIASFSDSLGQQQFFAGDKPSAIDATMYGFLIQILWVPWDSEVKQFARSKQNLLSYCDRMKARYWTEKAS